MKKTIYLGIFLSLALFSCGDKTASSSENASSAEKALPAEKASIKTPEEFAKLKCEYLTKEKAAKDAGNKEEREKFDELGDNISKEVEKVFKGDEAKVTTFHKLVGECRDALKATKKSEGGAE